MKKKKLTINSLALGNLKHRKKRYILMILGIVLSMFTAIVVSRLLVNIMYNLSGGKASFLGLKKEVLFDEED